MNPIPNSILWGLRPEQIRGKNYLKTIDYIRENTEMNTIIVNMGNGVIQEDYDQCHGVMAELVDYAHRRGLKIAMKLVSSKGFYNPGANPDVSADIGQRELFTIENIHTAQALAQEYEMTADENGSASFVHEAFGARSKFRPLYNRLLKVYAFRKTAEGFYAPETLEDITDRAVIVQNRTYLKEFDIPGGKENAGKTFYALVAQYYNRDELFGGADWKRKKAILDLYADIPLDGVCLDENGFMLLNVTGVNNGTLPPFRHRLYSDGHREYYREAFGLDLDRELFAMRYAPDGDDSGRIRAINRYFDSLRVPVIDVENRTAAYAKKLFGEDIYIGVHNTFHNRLDQDEVWHTACAWWDLPRRFGHTDEYIPFPVRMGILLAAEDPRMIHMYYAGKPETIYREMVTDARYNIRICHHALDSRWPGSCDYRDPEMVRTIRVLDKALAGLNDFQNQPPQLDLLILYGNTAQNNWYPDGNARSKWDINGSLGLYPICESIWKAGWRAAMVPDYAVCDGRVRFENGRVLFNGYAFTHLLFLYPRYAKKEVYSFLDEIHAAGFPMTVAGDADMDFDAEKTTPSFETFPAFALSQLEAIGCPKSAIPHGCLYRDGSFCLVTDGLWNGETTEFDFTVGNDRYTGAVTGLLAFRRNRIEAMSKGSRLFRNGVEILP